MADMLSKDEIKKAAGVYATTFVEYGTTIGIGSGSTVFYFIEELGKMIAQGFRVTIVPTSKRTETLATQWNIPVVGLNDVERLLATIDGADEVNPQLQLIKGGGGALLQEKIVAAASEQLIIIVDYSKLVQDLGKFPLPVEVIDFGYKRVQHKIYSLGCSKVELRKKNDQPFITDHGNYILDCYFDKIPDPASLNISLHNIPGVVETGLFIDMANKIIVGQVDGKMQTIKK
jgi:ribose 5-phosphate isomerase A